MLSASAQRTFKKITQELDQRRSGLAPRPALLGQLPRMAGTVEAVVCICVAAFGSQEERALAATLRQLQQQRFPTAQWEAVVFCNWPQGAAPDRCSEIVRRFQRRLRNIHCLEMEMPQGTTIGVIRKLLHDAVAVRAWVANRDVMHITMDADTPWVHPDLIAGFIRRIKQTGADACVGQLDWENSVVPTATVPQLLVGQEIMRLLPRYGNKQIIVDPRSSISLLLEAVFSPRSFGRGVQSNFAFCTSAYQRAGGYLPQPHDEFDSLLRRIWLSRFRETGEVNALTFGWADEGIAVKSDSRRALWALTRAGLPPMRQWDKVPFLPDDEVRYALPSLDNHRGHSVEALQRQINLTLEAFNLPSAQLNLVVEQALSDIGLSPVDYELAIASYESDSVLGLAQIRITNPEGLWCWIRRQQAAG